MRRQRANKGSDEISEATGARPRISVRSRFYMISAFQSQASSATPSGKSGGGAERKNSSNNNKKKKMKKGSAAAGAGEEDSEMDAKPGKMARITYGPRE